MKISTMRLSKLLTLYTKAEPHEALCMIIEEMVTHRRAELILQELAYRGKMPTRDVKLVLGEGKDYYEVSIVGELIDYTTGAPMTSSTLIGALEYSLLVSYLPEADLFGKTAACLLNRRNRNERQRKP